MIMDLEIFGNTFQSSTPMERKGENANVTSHIIPTGHGAEGYKGSDKSILEFKMVH